jgi:hypothetical protein
MLHFNKTYFIVKNKRNIDIKGCEKDMIIPCVDSASLMKTGEGKS